MHSESDLYDDFVRTHHGATSIQPTGFDFSYDDAIVTPNAGNRQKDIGVMRDDPFSMDFGGQSQQRKETYKPVVDRSEF